MINRAAVRNAVNSRSIFCMAVIVVMFINHIVIVGYVLYSESNIRETALLLHQNVLIKRNELNMMQFRLLNL